MRKTQKLITSSFIALVLAQILWGILTPVIKLGLQSVPVTPYLALTILGASLLILPMALKNWVKLGAKDYSLLVIGSIIAIAVGNSVMLMGLKKVPSINAPIIGLFSPLLLFILSVEFLKERINLRTFAGILLAFAGGAVIVGNPLGVTSSNPEVVSGNLLILLAVLCDVVGILICKSALKKGGSYQVTFLHLFWGVLPVAILSLTYWSSISLDSIGRAGMLAITYNILAVAFANALFMYGLKARQAQSVGIFQYIHPLVTLIAAWFILGEVPSDSFIPGAVLVLTGITLAESKLRPNLHLLYHRRKN